MKIIVNYGLFYNDLQLIRILTRHAQVIENKSLLVGECGHEHKTQFVISEPFIEYPRKSIIELYAEEVYKHIELFNADQNDFPITYHDSCSFARNMGMVEPQRHILNRISRKFVEMTPKGTENYCCGAGSGLAVLHTSAMKKWTREVSGAEKMKQIEKAFAPFPANIRKYVVTNCSNCKGQFRNLLEGNKDNISYTGMAEIICNALIGLKKPIIE